MSIPAEPVLQPENIRNLQHRPPAKAAGEPTSSALWDGISSPPAAWTNWTARDAVGESAQAPGRVPPRLRYPGSPVAGRPAGALQAHDLRFWELAGGLEPPTCCLQGMCRPSGAVGRMRFSQ